jgi:hypothetical protein
VNCIACPKEHSSELIQKCAHSQKELVAAAKRLLKTASDPFTAVINFLHERPENASMPGFLVNKVLEEAFGDRENIPSLVRILSTHVRELRRHKGNVIELINEHPAAERWGQFILKQRERINFEVAMEKGMLVLKNITGLVGVEHGVELPLDKILVQPPKLIVTVKLGILRPQKEVEILAK